MPRVSIISPTYNCARYLGHAIDSTRAQTYTDYEILVVDDGSTDDTKDVVMQYRQGVIYLYQENRGVSAARNHAISKANGELLAYLDADDVWYSEKLERQVAFLDAHQECGMVHSEISVINERDEILHAPFNEGTKRSIHKGTACRSCSSAAIFKLSRWLNVGIVLTVLQSLMNDFLLHKTTCIGL